VHKSESDVALCSYFLFESIEDLIEDEYIPGVCWSSFQVFVGVVGCIYIFLLHIHKLMTCLKRTETVFPVMDLVLSSPRKNASYVNKSE
jgi:hypothetical protein